MNKSIRQFVISIFFLIAFNSSAAVAQSCGSLFGESVHPVTYSRPDEGTEKNARGDMTVINPFRSHWKNSKNMEVKKIDFGRDQEPAVVLQTFGSEPGFASIQQIYGGSVIRIDYNSKGINMSKMLGTSGISFVAKGRAGSKIKVILRAEHQLYLEASVTVNESDKQFYLRWNDFQKLENLPDSFSEFDRSPDPWATKYQTPESLIYFQVGQASDPSPSQVTLAGPIIFERELRPDYRTVHRLVTQHYFHHEYANNPPPESDPIYQKRYSIVKKMLTNVYSKKAQDYAIAEANKGQEYVDTKLKKMGFNIYHIAEGKIETANFFFLGPMVRNFPSVPMEVSSFGREHGVISHGAQIFAMTFEMSPTEMQSFMEVYQKNFGDQPIAWLAWDTVFDAPGNLFPNGPRWWRDRIKK